MVGWLQTSPDLAESISATLHLFRVATCSLIDVYVYLRKPNSFLSGRHDLYLAAVCSQWSEGSHSVTAEPQSDTKGRQGNVVLWWCHVRRHALSLACLRFAQKKRREMAMASLRNKCQRARHPQLKTLVSLRMTRSWYPIPKCFR